MLRPALIALSLGLGSAVVSGQCTPQWLPGAGTPGFSGTVNATTMWDPDGVGPLTPRLVVGGSFRSVGAVAVDGIAAYNPATGVWSALGGGIDGSVGALAVLPNGDLVASGLFTTAGGVAARNIARWNGSVWSPMGSGLSSAAALAVLPNGDLVAGGHFTAVGPFSVTSRVVRWNGTTWSPMGSGLPATVTALAVLPNGDLVAGSGGECYRWNGTTWSTMGGFGGYGDAVFAFAVLPNGDLVAGGRFHDNVSAVNRILRWNGTSWSALGGGINLYGQVFALAVLPNGNLVAGGFVTTADGLPANNIARWNGSAWSALGSVGSTAFGCASGGVYALAVLPNGDLVAGGGFGVADGIPATNIARWNGSAWSAMAGGPGSGPELTGFIQALVVLPNGDLVAAGCFTSAGGVTVNGVARWNGSTWSALGSGMDNLVLALAVLPNGDLVAGGTFATAGEVVASRIARWDGSDWSPLGSGLGPPTGSVSFSYVNALAVLPNGDLVVGGEFTSAGGVAANHIARWNGSAWSPMGSGLNGFDSNVSALAVLPNGDLVVGGWFTAAGGVAANSIARWTGNAWSALGNGFLDPNYLFGIGAVGALAVLPNGDLIASGEFTTAGSVAASNIARWNGSAWSALGSGISSTPYHRSYVGALAVLPNGDLIAGGGFTTAGSVAASNIARWNGSAWSALGSGLSGGLFGDVNALALQPDGRLAVGGWFEIAGGNVSAYFARYATPCVATVASSGAACASSGGANSYAAVTRPWTGAAYRTRGTGLPAAGVVAVVNGFTSVSIPLAAVLPPSPAGCTLLAAPDVVDIALASAGTVDAQLALPNTPALAGVALHQQLIALEVDAQLNFVQTTSTNALVATIGTF
jgi:trimeric autotransporter adhesin